MKTKRKILSLTISTLLTAGVASYTMTGYADNDGNNGHGTRVEETTEATPQAQSASGTDSDKRGTSDISDRKITICHVPPGNPANKHTIHIAYSAWAAHKAHTNAIGPDYVDYLGSCNSKTTASAKETLHVISGCTGTAREALETKVQAYYEPITVADTALDDESVFTAMSRCLDQGDSSDSGHGNSTSTGKGGGRDSVSDSGNHHRIRGCQNKSTRTDSDRNYNTKLKTRDSDLDTSRGITDPIVVSDSSLDDNSVWTAYKACTQDATNANKIDPSKTGKKMGDSGHRQYSLNSCNDTQATTLKTAITSYKAKTSTKDIILTASSYNDAQVKAAVDACVSQTGVTDKTTDSFSPNVAIHGVTINHATVTNAVIASNKITGGTITAGTSPTATVIGGTISAGTVTGGTTSGTTITDTTITGATVYTGVSGRLNFRENTSPIKDVQATTTTTDTSTSSTTDTSTSSTPGSSTTPLSGQ